MSASKLVKPSTDYKESYLEALREYQEEGRYAFLNLVEIDDGFENFVSQLCEGKRHLHKPYADWAEPVPETVLWLIKDTEYIGTFNIRHRLNWHLEKWGGHINFIIRPSMRDQGFGKKILQKAIPYICYLGIDRALLTVSPKNLAGQRIVEFCGADFEDETQQTERFPPRKRYWLECG